MLRRKARWRAPSRDPRTPFAAKTLRQRWPFLQGSIPLCRSGRYNMRPSRSRSSLRRSGLRRLTTRCSTRGHQPASRTCPGATGRRKDHPRGSHCRLVRGWDEHPHTDIGECAWQRDAQNDGAARQPLKYLSWEDCPSSALFRPPALGAPALRALQTRQFPGNPPTTNDACPHGR